MRVRGFSLVEALVALFVVAMAFGFVFTFFSGARESVEFYGNHSRAALVGRQILERARRVPFAQLADASGTRTWSGQVEGREWRQDVTWTFQVQAVDALRKKAWVTLRWTEQGKTRQVVVETVITDRGQAGGVL